MSEDGRKAIRWTGVAALLAAAVGAVTVAVAEEASAPKKGEGVAVVVTTTTTRPQQGGRGEGVATTSRPWKGGRVGEEAGGRMRGPTEEEWRDVSEFMARYSPNRLKAIEEQGSGDGPRFASLRKFVWGHYRELMGIKEKGDQELYDLKVKIAQAEDEVFGLQRQMRAAPEPDRPVLRHQMRQKVGEMVRLGLKERELRIARLEKALAEEKEKLAADEKSVDQHVVERMQVLSKGMRERKREDGGGGGAAATAPAVGSQVK